VPRRSAVHAIDRVTVATNRFSKIVSPATTTNVTTHNGEYSAPVNRNPNTMHAKSTKAKIQPILNFGRGRPESVETALRRDKFVAATTKTQSIGTNEICGAFASNPKYLAMIQSNMPTIHIQ
jgi:hypothetical protein